MKKKILAMCLVIALAMTAIAGATLAYFTDTDDATNVFVSGNFDLELWEDQRVPNGKGGYDLDDFVQNKQLFPVVGDLSNKDECGMVDTSVKNYQDKIVRVALSNNDFVKTEAYVRVKYAVPADLEDNHIIVVDLAEEYPDWQWVEEKTVTDEVNGVQCNIHTYTYKTALDTDVARSQPLMYGVYMPSTVTQVTEPHPEADADYSITVMYKNDAEAVDMLKYENEDGIQIPVFAQAVQAEGFADAAAAFAAAKLPDNPWAPVA